jgi:4-hydroxy-4-methyl-2-oxoglutarate aldolase
MSDAPTSDIARRLEALSTSAISDATGGVGAMSPGLARVGGGTATVAGPAVTAESAPGSVFAIFGALDQARPGDVLCMTAPGDTAYLGDTAAHDIANRGLVAVVVDGLVRDAAALAELPVAFFARGTSPVARRGPGTGRSMVPVVLGGVDVSPGDWVVADADGVVVVAAADIERVLAHAEQAAEVDARMVARVKAGATLPEAIAAERGIDWDSLVSGGAS